jgi:hypothetical protein
VFAPDLNLRLRPHETQVPRCYTGVTPPAPPRLKALGFRVLGHFVARAEEPRFIQLRACLEDRIEGTAPLD